MGSTAVEHSVLNVKVVVAAFTALVAGSCAGCEAPCYRCPPCPLSSSQSPEAAAAGHWAPVELLIKVKRRFAKISQSWRRPLLGPITITNGQQAAVRIHANQPEFSGPWACRAGRGRRCLRATAARRWAKRTSSGRSSAWARPPRSQSSPWSASRAAATTPTAPGS